MVYLFNGKEFLNSEKRFEILSPRRVQIIYHLTRYYALRSIATYSPGLPCWHNDDDDKRRCVRVDATKCLLRAKPGERMRLAQIQQHELFRDIK